MPVILESILELFALFVVLLLPWIAVFFLSMLGFFMLDSGVRFIEYAGAIYITVLGILAIAVDIMMIANGLIGVFF